MVAKAYPDSTASRALRRIQAWGRGKVFVPHDFLDLGTRRAVDAALRRLTASGRIRHLGRGVYDYPRTHPRLGIRTPSVDDVAAAVARGTGESIVVSEARAANALGVTSQVPARATYLTSGTSRTLRIGPHTIRFRHAAPSRLAGGDSRAGMAVRALRFLGRDGLDPQAQRALVRALGDDDRQQLQNRRQLAPAWMRPMIDDIVLGVVSGGSGRGNAA